MLYEISNFIILSVKYCLLDKQKLATIMNLNSYIILIFYVMLCLCNIGYDKDKHARALSTLLQYCT